MSCERFTGYSMERGFQGSGVYDSDVSSWVLVSAWFTTPHSDCQHYRIQIIPAPGIWEAIAVECRPRWARGSALTLRFPRCDTAREPPGGLGYIQALTAEGREDQCFQNFDVSFHLSENKCAKIPRFRSNLPKEE